MAKPRVRMQPTRATVADTQAVKMLNPDAWREGKSSNDIGYNYCWRKFRESWLRKHPLCVRCEAEGKVVEATVLDHVIPHRGDQTLFWKAGNHQGLCQSCHSRKTALEDGGIGEARRG